VAEHLGVDADLFVQRVVFIDGEVVLAEKLEKSSEKTGREVDGLEGRGIGIEETTVEVGNTTGFRFLEEVALAFGIESLEEEAGEEIGVEGVGGFRSLCEFEVAGEEVTFALGPVGGVGGAAEPALFLEEGEEDEATEEFLYEVADGFVGDFLGGGVGFGFNGKEGPGGGGLIGVIFRDELREGSGPSVGAVFFFFEGVSGLKEIGFDGEEVCEEDGVECFVAVEEFVGKLFEGEG